MSGTAAEAVDFNLRIAVRQLQDASSVVQQLVGGAPVQMLLLDRELNVRWVNELFAKARKIDPAAAAGRAATEFFGDLSGHSTKLARALAGEPMQLHCGSGSPHTDASARIVLQLRPWRDATGAVGGLWGYVTDVSAPQYASIGMPNAADAMRQIIGSLPDYVFLLDRELRVLFANRPLGARTAAELEGLQVTEFFPQHLHPVALATLHRVMATGKVDGYTAECDTAEGPPRHFEVFVTPVLQDSRIVALTLVASETTEQIRAERAIATQARMIESMLEGVAVINERGVIEITNPAFDAMFGFERGGLIGRELATLAGRSLDQHYSASAASADGSVKVEFEARRRDGSYFSVAGVLSAFEVAGGNHRLAVLQDVSERKQLERAILQAVNREQYRIGNDLHDGLGQELTGIALMLRGVAGRLTTEYPVVLPEVEGITRLVSNAIENTRALARGLSPVNLERGGLQDALEGLAMHAMDLYGVQVTFSQRAPSGRLLNAEVANHLYRIAQEAVSNAVRHGKARSIRLHLSIVRAKVRLTVTDDGIGMPDAALDAAGMGLKTMQYRARMLGGEVQFEAAEPNGTRIVCECLAEPPVTQARPARVPRRRTRTAR